MALHGPAIKAQGKTAAPHGGKVLTPTAERRGAGIASSGRIFAFLSNVELYDQQGPLRSPASSALP